MPTSPQNSRLPADTTAEICTLLAVQIGVGLNDRQAVLTGAFGFGSPIAKIVEFGGSADTFAAHLVEKLLNYGTTEDSITKRQSPALAILLRSLTKMVGYDVAARLNRLAETVEVLGRQSTEEGDRPPPTAQKWVDNEELPEPDPNTLLIFLCHGKEDKAYVRLLYRRLVADGYYPWLDEIDIVPGEIWEREIYNAIQRSERFIVCLSNNTTGERFFQKEIANALTIAEARGLETGYILPIRWEECPIPDRLGSRHAAALFPIDIAARSLSTTGYRNLLKALKKPLPMPALKDAAAYINRGNEYRERKEYDKAIADYTEAIRLDPKYAVAYYNRGLAYYNLKEYDKAIADYTEAIRLNPKYANAYYNRGLAYYNLKEYDKAIADYTEAIRLDPKYVFAYYNRGLAYYNLKEYDKAIADYTEAIRLDPKYVFAYHNRGIAYHNLNQYDKAIADYTEAIRLDPKYALAYIDRGLAYYNLKEYDKAIADYTEAIRLNPKYANAYIDRGVAYNNLKEYDKAIADYEKYLELAPDGDFATTARTRIAELRKKL